MTDQTILPVEAVEAAARVLHAELNAPKFAVGSCLRCRQDAELMLAAAYPHLRQQWEAEHSGPADGYCTCDDRRPWRDCGVRAHRQAARGAAQPGGER